MIMATRQPHWLLRDPLEPRQPHETDEEFERRIDETLTQKIDLLFDHYQIDRSDPRASWHLACSLASELYSGFRFRQPPGKKVERSKTVDDLILGYGVDQAKKNDPSVSVKTIIRDLAEQNGWPTSIEHIDTLHRRYYNLKRKRTPERRRAAEMVAAVFPRLLDHFEKKPLAKKKTK